MKNNLIIASLLALGTSSLAMEIKPFVGIDLSNINANYTETLSLDGGTISYGGNTYNVIGNYSDSDSSNDTSPVLKGGLLIDNTHRVYAKYGTFDGDYSSEITLTTINYDYLFSNFENEYNITPYAGAFLGHTEIDTNIGNDSGFVYGGTIGATIPINKNIEFDFSFAYMKFNVEAKDSVNNISGTYGGYTLANVSGSDTIELDDARMFSIGFNYKF